MKKKRKKIVRIVLSLCFVLIFVGSYTIHTRMNVAQRLEEVLKQNENTFLKRNNVTTVNAQELTTTSSGAATTDTKDCTQFAYDCENSFDLESRVTSIITWGDSMTAGVNGDGVSYPLVLERLTGITTENYGISGDSSEEITDRAVKYGSTGDSVVIIEMGDNGGWDNNFDELIQQYHEIIDAAGTDKYIIISSTDDPNDYDQIWAYTDEAIGLENTWYEEALEQEFGDHVLKARQYLIQYGLEISGLRADEADQERAQMGYISEKLRKVNLDNTHLNAAGYTAQAYGVYELGIQLGYWN